MRPQRRRDGECGPYAAAEGQRGLQAQLRPQDKPGKPHAVFLQNHNGLSSKDLNPNLQAKMALI